MNGEKTDCAYQASVSAIVCEERHALRDNSLALCLIIVFLIAGAVQEIRTAREERRASKAAPALIGMAFLYACMLAVMVVTYPWR